MKQKLIILIVLCSLLVICGCGTIGFSYNEAKSKGTSGEDILTGYFTVITEWEQPFGTCYIVYANETKVKYLLMFGDTRSGITPLYNQDGSLQVYDENTDN